MSTNYYIFNRKNREEIQEFNRFWEETFIPGLKQQVEDYCCKRNGTYVNTDFGNEIIKEKIAGISGAPGKSESYETVIGVSHWNGKRNLFQWEGSYVDISYSESFYQKKDGNSRDEVFHSGSSKIIIITQKHSYISLIVV